MVMQNGVLVNNNASKLPKEESLVPKEAEPVVRGGTESSREGIRGTGSRG